MQLDYTFDRQLMLERRDSREEGWEEGRKEGHKVGREEGGIEKIITLICKKLKKNKTIEEIADDLEEDVGVIEPICRIAESFAPEYDYQRVLERYMAVRAVK